MLEAGIAVRLACSVGVPWAELAQQGHSPLSSGLGKERPQDLQLLKLRKFQVPGDSRRPLCVQEQGVLQPCGPGPPVNSHQFRQNAW